MYCHIVSSIDIDNCYGWDHQTWNRNSQPHKLRNFLALWLQLWDSWCRRRDTRHTVCCHLYGTQDTRQGDSGKGMRIGKSLHHHRQFAASHQRVRNIHFGGYARQCQLYPDWVGRIWIRTRRWAQPKVSAGKGYGTSEHRRFHNRTQTYWGRGIWIWHRRTWPNIPWLCLLS